MLSIILIVCAPFAVMFTATVVMLWWASNHAPIIDPDPVDVEVARLLLKADVARELAQRVAL